MPVWLRKFTFNKIHEHYEKKNNPQDDTQDSWVNPTSNVAKPPDFVQKMNSNKTKYQ